MSDGPGTEDGRLTIRLGLARAALLWERAWPASWPVLAVAALWLILALFDVLPLLPGLLHLAVLLGLAAALGVAGVAAGRAVVLPDRSAARRRIETASGLAHRPLAALADQPSGYLDGPAARLWEAHRRRMAAAARSLRVGFPLAGLARRDPWGLRSLLTILLIIGVIDAGGDWRERLVRAVTPSLAFGTAAPAPSLDIWITPPDYTGLPPRFLKPGATATIPVPAGSTLLAQLHGSSAVPHLSIDNQRRDFTVVDKHDFRISAKLTQGKRLTVTQAGTTLGSWPIAIVADQPPTTAFARAPQATSRGALRIDYAAADDYGIESVKLVIRRLGGKPGERLEVPLELPGLHLKQAKATSYHDLTPNPWAGLPVEMRLVAGDALGQTGQSAPVRLTLPERIFHNPVARAIIDQRKELVKDPAARESVAEILGDLRGEHAMYHEDAVVFLGLRLAQERLRLDKDAASTAEVEQLMWDTAVRIEDGNMSVAERELRRLQQQLLDALANNRPDAEIERLMAELQRAIDRYLQSLAQDLAKHPQQATQPIDPSQIVTRRDLQRMLDRARELARAGDREQARQLLSQLQDMLENLRAAQAMPQNGDEQAQQTMNGLRDLVRRQQQLLDRSFRAQQQAPTGPQGQMGQPGQSPDALGDAANQQDALRHALGDVMRRLGDQLGDIPNSLGRAERAMRNATQALQRNLPGEAIGPQTEALDQLQQAARQFAQRMQQQMRPGNSPTGSAEDQPTELRRDPLGRPLANNGSYDQGDVKIPDHNTLERARAILDELRRRASDPDRPEIERDYIDRLLKQF
jgi:uncharacterized protein (TIGR02302 family)